ncbi:MAG: xylulokinase [Burkholderiales bacterium]|nr:MAG: xylulokinase [Burkholderiales bacterium]
MYLGLDMGTSEVKAVLLDTHHRLIASAGVSLDLQHPAPGYAEQEPTSWWNACVQACAQLREAHAKDWVAVRGIGLSGQMHGAVLLDAACQVLRPAILWNDTRSHIECVEMMAAHRGAASLAGSLIMPGFTAPKLAWLRKHEPQNYSRIAHVVLPKDYVRLQLTGDIVSDMSDASGTAWLDVAKRDWSDELLALSGLTRSHMPRLVEGSASSGGLSALAAKTLGLSAGIVVAGGGGDNAASAVGMGVAEPGQGFLSLGTSGVLFLVTPGFRPNPPSATHAFCHALPDRWHQMSVMLSAASCLQWASQILGQPVAQLVSLATALPQASQESAPIFLPYLSGERTPHNSAQVRGCWHGLTHDTDAATLAYSVMEGVSFGLCDGLAALQAAGCEATQLSLVGGGSRSAFWAQLLASSLGVNIFTHGGAAIGGALGAARLAWLADGAELSQVCIAPPIEATYQPIDSQREVLMPRLARFRSLYQG